MKGRGRSPETQALVRCFSALAPGVENAVSFAQVEAIIHADPRKDVGYSKVNTAKKVVRRENRIVISMDKNAGYYRLTDAEASKTGDKGILASQRIAFHALDVLGCVDYDQLTAQQKESHIFRASKLQGVLNASMKTPQQLVASEPNPKLIEDTLAAFLRKTDSPRHD